MRFQRFVIIFQIGLIDNKQSLAQTMFGTKPFLPYMA